MKYKQQLYFIVSFIGLRLVMLILYTFFKPAQPGPYTPYVLFLYTLFDVLIICYLYRFVKVIKRQSFSIIPILLIIVSTIYMILLDRLFDYETSGLTPLQTILIVLPASLIGLIGKISIAFYLIRNKVQDNSRKYLMSIGWTYVMVLLIGFLPLAHYFFIPPYSDAFHYIISLSSVIPLVSMLALYVYELRNDSNTENHIGRSTIDSEV